MAELVEVQRQHESMHGSRATIVVSLIGIYKSQAEQTLATWSRDLPLSKITIRVYLVRVA